MENTGTNWLEIEEILDLLPEGFSFSIMLSGDIPQSPSDFDDFGGRQEVTWSPSLLYRLIAPGNTKTLKFTAIASVPQGNYWSDVLVEFEDGFEEPVYTWPTALVSVKDVYDVTVTDDEGNAVLITLQVWIGDENGEINTWDLQ